MSRKVNCLTLSVVGDEKNQLGARENKNMGKVR